ncbi:hypothetical protein Q876_08955 [Listeria monocytogenes]|nr:hypothetical protein [Listeria monocytogenes]
MAKIKRIIGMIQLFLGTKAANKRVGMLAMNFEHMIGRDTEKGIIITDPKEELKHAASHKSDNLGKKRQKTRVQHPSGRK